MTSKKGGRSRRRGKKPDFFSQKAKTDRFPARSVYKLEAIQKKFGVLSRGARVLDLGCSPGSWLLYAAEVVGTGGRVTGVDLNPLTIALPPQAEVYQLDVLAEEAWQWIAAASGWEVVLSDMAPNTTGSKATDAARSFHLARAALAIARQGLKPGGSLVCKIFQGQDFKSFVDMVKKEFNNCKIFKPEACRDESRETYVIGLEKKENTHGRS